MKTGESFGTIDDLNNRPVDKFGGLVYLIESDPVELMKKYDAIRADKGIVSAYSIGSKHCLVLNVFGNIKIKQRGN